MSRLLQRASTRETRILRPLYPGIEFAERETGQIGDRAFQLQKEYEIKLILSQKFWANEEQYRTHRDIALKALSSELYRDLRHLVVRARHLINNGEQTQALLTLSELEAELTT